MKKVILPILKVLYIGWVLCLWILAYGLFFVPIYILHFLWHFKPMDAKKEIQEVFTDDYSEPQPNKWLNIPKVKDGEVVIFTSCFHRLLRLEKPRIEKIKER